MKILKTQFFKSGKVQVTVKEGKEEAIHHFGNKQSYLYWKSEQENIANVKLIVLITLGLSLLSLIVWLISIS